MTTALSILFFVLTAIGAWKIFAKAGLPGWVALVPVLNCFGVIKLLGKSYWWIVFFVPVIYPFTHFVLAVLVAWRFGKSALFGLGLAFLPFLFVPLLGFSDARYLGAER
jgi:hypothetical protein